MNLALPTFSDSPVSRPMIDNDRPELLHELFEHTVDRYPDAPAVVFGSDIQTYRDLEARANRIARYLRSTGVRSGDCVAVQLPKSHDLYAAMLGILKAGAAYVPLAPDCPADRSNYILDDCHVHSIITSTAAKSAPCRVIPMDALGVEIARQSDERLTRETTGTTPENCCYIIYTSGSTGLPKGVQIEHRNAVNLVKAEGCIFPLTQEDRVYQGFSVAFDASVEEIWLAFFNGATLVPATLEMSRAGPGLSRLLTEARVTVFSCVPTLLSMMDEDIPTMRILIFGGETCPADLVQRWTRPGLRIVNTYGPTETTVIATWQECRPDKPVTIGKPVQNYEIHILDDSLKPVKSGEQGEICIGGPGVARGYVGRPDLTAERFIPNSFGNGRLYRTGDIGSYTSDGEIEFHGRLDGQVKLRGFRIELSEIENALLKCPGIKAAAVTVREDLSGIGQLVAYVIHSSGGIVNEDELRTRLSTGLPSFMIPGIFEAINEFPMLPSGKIDRKKLPPPRRRRTAAAIDADDLPCNSFEHRLAEVWGQLFASRAIGRNADFFRDLGGHSLLAARMVTMLRNDPDFNDISMPDVYTFPVLSALAGEIAKRRGEKVHETATTSDIPETSSSHRTDNNWRCGAYQFIGLYLLIGFFALEWLIPTFVVEGVGNTAYPVLLASFVWLGIHPLLCAATVALKWVLIGRYKPAKIRLWGFQYLCWWLVNRMQSMVPVHFLVGTPWLNIYARLMGARIGKRVFLGTEHIGAFDLIDIGDDTTIGLEAAMLGYTVRDGFLIIAPISIGKRCFVGTRSVLGGNTKMFDGARLEALSLLPENEIIPAKETWVGSPARPLPKNNSNETLETPESVTDRKSNEFATGVEGPAITSVWYALLQLFGIAALLSLVPSAILPGCWITVLLEKHLTGSWFWSFVPILGVTFAPVLLLEIAGLKWLLLGRVNAGSYPLAGSFYVRKWFIDQLLDLSLIALGQVYATLYVIPFLRMLGASLGLFVEVSTAHGMTPDLIRMDEGSFIADSVSLGAGHIDMGMLTLGQVHLGQRSFIGNSALVPGETEIGEGGLIGVASTRPCMTAQAAEPGSSWLGSPAMFLPHRYVNTEFPLETTYRPTRSLIALRLGIEFLRVTLPPTFSVLLGGIPFALSMLIAMNHSWMFVLAVYPSFYLACGVMAALIVIVAKKLLIRRYRAMERPLWSSFVWRTELLTALHEHLADPFLIRMLEGTPFIACFFRALGAKVGRRVYMETTSLTEFDLIEIGDEAALNRDSVVQTHLFEDRVMKMAPIRIGERCSLGARAIILYNTEMQIGSELGDVSLAMKGEMFQAMTRWVGLPCRRAVPPVAAIESGKESTDKGRKRELTADERG
ncbi:MAG: amino acid adenylation domain-containing protein [Candidatus Riflebacteria bacterium]|nr:amino acid adenylation domain-containing protein [Candidatus Riflebacteria bacterium]